MKFPILFLAYKSIVKNPRRSILLFLANLLSISFIVSVVLIGLSAIESIQNSRFDTYGEHKYLALNTDAEFEKILDQSNEIDSFGCFRLYGSYTKDEESLFKDLVTIGQADSAALKLGHIKLTSGRLPRTTGEVAIEQAALNKMGQEINPGDSLTIPVQLLGEDHPTEMEFKVTGILSNYSKIWCKYPNTLTVETEIPAILTASPLGGNLISHVIYKPVGSIFSDQTVYDHAQSIVANTSSYPYETEADTSSQIYRYIYLVIILIAVLLGSISIISIVASLKISISQRYRQLLVLRTIGASKGRIIQSSLIEIALLAGGALPVGYLFGYGIAVLINTIFSTYLSVQLPLRGRFAILLAICLLLFCIEILAADLCLRLHFRRSGRKSKRKPLKQLSRSRLLSRILINDQWSASLIVLIMTLSIFISFPIQIIFYSYADSFTYSMPADFVLYQQTTGAVGSLLINEDSNAAFQEKEIKEIQQLQGVKRVRYSFCNNYVKILSTDKNKNQQFEAYTKATSGTSCRLADLPGAPPTLERDKKSFGYSQNDAFFQCSAVGLDQEEIDSLQPYLIDGTINSKLIENGQQLIAVKWKSDAPAEYPFAVGESVNFTELQLTEMSENDFESPHKAERDFQAEIGAVIELEKESTILGEVYSFSNDFVFIFGNETVQTYQIPQSIDSILIDVNQDCDLKDLNNQLKNIASSHIGTVCESSYEQNLSLKRFNTTILLLGYGLSLTISILGLLIQYSISAARIEFKKRNIALLHMIGTNQRTMRKTLLREGILSCLLSGVLAVLLALLVSQFFSFPLHWIPLSFMMIYTSILLIATILVIYITIYKKIKYSNIFLTN